MSKRKRLFFIFILTAILLTVPMAALARKQVWKARLTTDAELHDVVGSSATGSAVFATNPDGSLHFVLFVRGLSGPATGAHIHAPATTAQNAPVVLTLCGNPAPSAAGACTMDAAGNLTVEADISGGLLAAWGLPGGQLLSWLNDGLAYVNVHTASNPAGEVRGQIGPQ